MPWFLWFACVALCGLATACAPLRYSDAERRAAFEEAVPKLKAGLQTPDGLRARLGGKTVRSFDTAHGTQISYYAPDGRYYHWYPGNATITSGQWKVIRRYALMTQNRVLGGSLKHKVLYSVFEDQKEAEAFVSCKAVFVCEAAEYAAICYAYDIATYNPVTRGRLGPGVFQCVQWSGQREREIEDTDILGLSAKAAAPFPLGREEATFAKLRAKIRRVDPQRLPEKI